MKSTPVANFIKLFGHYLQCSQLIAFNYDTGYAANCINYAHKRFKKSTPVANFIKLFWHNLR